MLICSKTLFPLVAFFLLVSACTAEITPSPSPVLLGPYSTATPSPTAARAEGLVESFETPLPTATPFTYVVKAGDTMSEIAERFGVSLDALMAANPQVSPSAMSVGQTLFIPSDPANLTGESTPTPVPFAVPQIECYPTADGGMWCFVLARNDTADALENITAQVMLIGADGETLASQTAILPLDPLPPGGEMPMAVYFPDAPSDGRAQARILTAIGVPNGDARYLPALLQNTLVIVDGSGRTARVSGQVILPEGSLPAKQVWVLAVVYDEAGRVSGVRRWEAGAELAPGGSLTFDFTVASLGSAIDRVAFYVEARP
ncbi:MAG: LysM peptidoglycan-binding domain-containing protein [Chloroflexota bacterium]